MHSVRNRRIVKRLWFFSGLLLLCAVVAVFLLPRLINTEMVRGRVTSILSHKLSGSVSFQDADVSLFPVPSVTIRNASLTIPDKLHGTISAITVFPKVLPLLCGDVRLSKMQIHEPVFTINIPEEKDESRRSLEKIAALLKLLTLGSRKLLISVEKGGLTLMRGSNPPVPVKEIDLHAAVTDKNNSVTLTIDRLSSKTPALSLSGAFFVDTVNSEVSANARSKNLRVMPVREAVLSLAGDVPVVAKIFDILRGGDVAQIDFQSSGRTMGELMRTPNITIKGRLKNGEIAIPAVGLQFRDVSGECDISGGILKGNDLAGYMANSHIKTGSLVIGLQRNDPQFHLEAAVDADLSDIKVVLKKTVKNTKFLHELELIQSIKGRAEGTLILGENLRKIIPHIETDNMSFAAAYGRVPYGIEVKKGRFTYDEKEAVVKDLSASIGKSSYSGLNARLQPGPRPHLSILSGKAEVDAEELQRWLESYESLKVPLRKIHSTSGRINLSSISFQGLVTEPQDWKFKLFGSVNKLFINTSLLPAPLSLKTGKFESQSGRMDFSDLDADFLDSSSVMSGSLNLSLESLRKGDIRFSGKVGPEAMQWIKQTFSIPEYVRTDHTVSVSGADLRWQEQGPIGFQGSLKTNSGQSLAMTLTKSPDSLTISRLTVEDKISKASFSLDLKEKTKSISFRGRLDAATAARLITTPQRQGGLVEGEFSARFSSGTAAPFSADGRLRGEKVSLPWKKDLPITIDFMVLRAEKNIFTVDSGLVSLLDNAFSLKGIIASRTEGLVMDMNVSSVRVAWRQLAQAFKKDDRADSATDDSKHDLRLLGTVRLKADTFLYDNMNIHDLYSEIELRPEFVSAAVKKGLYCNMGVTGSILQKKDNLNITLHVAAHDIELGPAIVCVTDKNAEMSGRFELDADIVLSGKTAIDPRSLHGRLDFRAKDGRIYRFTALAKIFSLLNVTEIFRGRVPDLLGEGFAYRSFIVSGDIKNGKLTLKETSIDSPSMGIVGEGNTDLISREADITILVAPFRTIDAVLNVLPGWKGGIVSIPFSVTGSLKDPQVAYKPSSVIRTGLTGFMENLLKAPVRLFEPLLPQEKK